MFRAGQIIALWDSLWIFPNTWVSIYICPRTTFLISPPTTPLPYTTLPSQRNIMCRLYIDSTYLCGCPAERIKEVYCKPYLREASRNAGHGSKPALEYWSKAVPQNRTRGCRPDANVVKNYQWPHGCAVHPNAEFESWSWSVWLQKWAWLLGERRDMYELGRLDLFFHWDIYDGLCSVFLSWYTWNCNPLGCLEIMLLPALKVHLHRIIRRVCDVQTLMLHVEKVMYLPLTWNLPSFVHVCGDQKDCWRRLASGWL